MYSKHRHRRHLALSALLVASFLFGALDNSVSAQTKQDDKDGSAFDVQPPPDALGIGGINAASTAGAEKKPDRMKARIQYTERPLKDGASESNAPGGVRNTPIVITCINTTRPLLISNATGLDYDLYLRRYDSSMPHAYPGMNTPTELMWQGWTSRILTDIHSIMEQTVTVPGYADFIVTAHPDGHCTAKLETLMGGPKFKAQALSMIDKLDRNLLLHYTVEQQDTPPAVSFKMGIGGFRPKGNEGHFYCGVEDEIPTASEQLKKRYSDYHL